METITDRGFALRERVGYPNGGTSAFYVRGDVALVMTRVPEAC